MSSYARDKYLDSIEVNSSSTLVVLTDQRVVALKAPRERDAYVALWQYCGPNSFTETQAPAGRGVTPERIHEKTNIRKD